MSVLSAKFEQQSLELVSFDEETSKFYITEKGKSFLNKLDKPIAPISIAGQYRTGKSYLINRLLKTHNTGFKTGCTTSSVTKGLNAWGKPFQACTQTGQQFYYIIIDSEGLGSLQKQAQYDNNLLLLIFLMSSKIIYNTLGAIDQLSLDQLRTIVNLKHCLTGKANINYNAQFIWVLRDFALQLTNKNGQQINPNQYLQFCLEQTSTSTSEGKRKNEIRKSIKEYIKHRSCFTLVRPTMQQSQLAELGLNKCKIRSQFLTQIEQLKEEIFTSNSQQIFKMGQKKVNGPIYRKILEEYLDILNKGSYPNIGNIWQSINQLSNYQKLEQCCTRMKDQVKKIKLPISRDELQRKLNQIENKLYSELSNFLGMNAQMRKNHKQFIKQSQKINQDLKKNNNEMLNKQLKSELIKIVRESVSFEEIRPSQTITLKNALQRMHIRAKKQNSVEGYEYILETVYDILHIIQQKSSKNELELKEIKDLLQQYKKQKKETDVSIITLKHDYHQSLKSLNEMKNQRVQYERKISSLCQQIQTLKITYAEQSSTKQTENHQYIEQINSKHRKKIEELNQSLKSLRDQNNELSSQLQQLNSKKSQLQVEQRKQFIFKQKMNNQWQKLEKQKSHYKELNTKLTQQLKIQTQQRNRADFQLEKAKKTILKMQQQQIDKELEFEKQFSELSRSIQQTKKSYQLTYQTMKNNDKILKSIDNITTNKNKINNQDQQKDEIFVLKRYQAQISSLKENNSQLRNQNEKLLKQYTGLKKQQQKYNDEIYDLRQKCIGYEGTILQLNNKFAECLNSVELAKQKQRSLYEQSIIRLLNNLDRGNN